jgi:hypothetical protein
LVCDFQGPDSYGLQPAQESLDLAIFAFDSPFGVQQIKAVQIPLALDEETQKAARSIQVLGKVTGWQVLPADAQDSEKAAPQACDLVLAGDPRIRKVPGKRRASRSATKKATESSKLAKAPLVLKPTSPISAFTWT